MVHVVTAERRVCVCVCVCVEGRYMVGHTMQFYTKFLNKNFWRTIG